MYLVGLIVIACCTLIQIIDIQIVCCTRRIKQVIQCVPAPGEHTKICRSCHHPVKQASDCTHLHHCKGTCVTDMYLIDGHYWYLYSCQDAPECSLAATDALRPDLGVHVCRDCCLSSGCDTFSCPQNTSTPVHTQATPTTTQATQPSTATLPDPTATSKHTVSVTQALATNGVSTSQPCVDTSASLLSCADMKSLGYCDPVAGAGYALAQIRCPLTCGFCVI